MILGIVLLVVMGFVFYVSKVFIEKKNTQIKVSPGQAAIDIQPLRKLVQSCVERLAKDAVVLLGKQGGFIYKSQGGTLADYSDSYEGSFFVRNGRNKVVYDIIRPRFAAEPYSAKVPEYPWHTFPYRTATANAKVYDGLFGQNNVPPLERNGGPHSIQSQVEAYVEGNIMNCVNFEKMDAYTIDAGQPLASAVIANSQISTKLRMNIKVTNKVGGEFTEIDEFSANTNIKFRDLYYFAKDLVEQDVSNVKFNIGGIENNREPYSVRIKKNIYKNDDLITVTDRKSIIDGYPLEYTFARKNRAPALYYIKRTNATYSQDYELNETDIVKESELRADDPDEDELNFTIIKGEHGEDPVSFPYVLKLPDVEFKVQVTDGELVDYQLIKIFRE